MSVFTKDRFEYEVLKQEALANQRPYLQFQLKDLRFLEKTSNGDSIISVKGNELIAPQNVIAGLDKQSGLSVRQMLTVYNAGGEDSVRDIRNYLSSAKAVTSHKSYVIYVDPTTRVAERVLPVLGSVISLEAFFMLAEMFMNQHNLLPEAFEYSSFWDCNVTLRMAYQVPDVQSLRRGEEFELSGYYMRWTGNQIELGLYLLRLVCSNGQTRQLGRSTGFRIVSLDAKDVDTLLRVPNSKPLINGSLDEFRHDAGLAMATPASMAELKSVRKMLLDMAIPEQECERIAPYEADLNAYKQKGFDHIDPKNTVSSVNTWDLYNRLTSFATHTDMWTPNALARDLLLHNAEAFLGKQRDIKSYVNIFK